MAALGQASWVGGSFSPRQETQGSLYREPRVRRSLPSLVCLKALPKTVGLSLLEVAKVQEAYGSHLRKVREVADRGIACVRGNLQEAAHEELSNDWMGLARYQAAHKVIEIAHALLMGDFITLPPGELKAWAKEQIEELKAQAQSLPDDWEVGLTSLQDGFREHLQEVEEASEVAGTKSSEVYAARAAPTAKAAETEPEEEGLDGIDWSHINWEETYVGMDSATLDPDRFEAIREKEKARAERSKREKSFQTEIKQLLNILNPLSLAEQEVAMPAQDQHGRRASQALSTSAHKALESALLETPFSVSAQALERLHHETYSALYMKCQFEQTVANLSSLSRSDTAKSSAEPIGEPSLALVNCLTLLGRAYYRMHNFEAAEKVFLEALYLKDGLGHRLSKPVEHVIMARLTGIYLALGKIDKALVWAVLSVDHFKICSERRYEKDFHSIRYIISCFSAEATASSASSGIGRIPVAISRRDFFLQAGQLGFGLVRDYVEQAQKQRERDYGGRQAYVDRLSGKVKGATLSDSPRTKALSTLSRRFSSSSFAFLVDVWSRERGPKDSEAKTKGAGVKGGLVEDHFIEVKMAHSLARLGRTIQLVVGKGFSLETFATSVGIYCPLLKEVFQFFLVCFKTDFEKIKERRSSLYRAITGHSLNEEHPNEKQIKEDLPKIRRFMDRLSEGEPLMITGFLSMHLISPLRKLVEKEIASE